MSRPREHARNRGIKTKEVAQVVNIYRKASELAKAWQDSYCRIADDGGKVEQAIIGLLEPLLEIENATMDCCEAVAERVPRSGAIVPLLWAARAGPTPLGPGVLARARGSGALRCAAAKESAAAPPRVTPENAPADACRKPPRSLPSTAAMSR